jgi:thiol-disulfide isomerase/thioredoxin
MAVSLPALPVAAGDGGELAPDWTLARADGAPLNFAAHNEGRPSVILFWATWCPYCRKLMPHLEKLREEYAPGGVNFYALNVWEDGDPVAYMKKNGYGFHLLLDADEVAKAYGVKGTPALFVVGANREVLYVRKSGTSPTQVESDLRFVLDNAPRASASPN